MSLFRLALVIGSSASFYVSATPPARSGRSERVNSSLNELILGTLVQSLFIAKLIPLTLAIIETFSTISFHIPNEHVPLLILSLRGAYPSEPPSAIFITASMLCMLGGVIRIICYRTLGRFFTFNLSIRKAHALITTGPYAYVRHPSYTAAVMVILPSIVMTLVPDSFVQTSGWYAVPAVKIIILIWVMYGFAGIAGCLGRVPDEDKLLKQTFGKEWENWASRVKYRLIPGVY